MKRITLWISFFVLLNESFAFAQTTEWKLEKSQDGISVYSRHVEGFPLEEIKCENTISASLSSIVAVIMDADHYTQWIYKCSFARVALKISETEQYQYQVNDLPSPLTDRDVVIHFTVEQDPATKIVTTHSVADTTKIPPVKGNIRIRSFDASYQLIPNTDGTVKIIYTLNLDPAGSIPDWLVNATIVTGPYQSTVKMIEQIKSDAYKNAKLDFISELSTQ